MRSPSLRLRRWSCTLAACAVASLAASAPAHATARVYRPAEVHRHLVVFHVAGVRRAAIRDARVSIGRRSFAVRRHALRHRRVRFHVPSRLTSRRDDARLRLVTQARSASRISAKRPKPAPTPTPIPSPSPTPTPSPGPTPAPPAGGTGQTTWRAVGSKPLADATAAALVTPAAETRPDNADENAYRPTAAQLDAFRNGSRSSYGETMLQYNPLTAYVTGDYSGTTDEILQWAAHKWGIPEDVVRAVAANESNWHMSQLGDRGTVPDPSLYPEYSRIAGTSDVYLSLGITQIKWRPNALHWGTEPVRWRSTAFNVDYWAANVRYYFDGLCSWCGAGYGAGQSWNSIGAWFNPSPWGSSTSYVDHVKQKMTDRVWAQPGF